MSLNLNVAVAVMSALALEFQKAYSTIRSDIDSYAEASDKQSDTASSRLAQRSVICEEAENFHRAVKASISALVQEAIDQVRSEKHIDIDDMICISEENIRELRLEENRRDIESRRVVRNIGNSEGLGVAREFEKLFSRYLNSFSTMIAVLEEEHWKLMALRSEVDISPPGPVFDDPKALKGFLRGLR